MGMARTATTASIINFRRALISSPSGSTRTQYAWRTLSGDEGALISAVEPARLLGGFALLRFPFLAFFGRLIGLGSRCGTLSLRNGLGGFRNCRRWRIFNRRNRNRHRLNLFAEVFQFPPGLFQFRLRLRIDSRVVDGDRRVSAKRRQEWDMCLHEDTTRNPVIRI